MFHYVKKNTNCVSTRRKGKTVNTKTTSYDRGKVTHRRKKSSLVNSNTQRMIFTSCETYLSSALGFGSTTVYSLKQNTTSTTLKEPSHGPLCSDCCWLLGLSLHTHYRSVWLRMSWALIEYTPICSSYAVQEVRPGYSEEVRHVSGHFPEFV